jgi:23S rRNA (cytosine1962-C5)-methyltransferase
MAAQIVLNQGKEEIIKRGHPWLFSGAIREVHGKYKPGDVVSVCDSNQKPLGQGFYNRKSDIAFRMLCPDPAVIIDREFWRQRISRALALRTAVLPAHTNAYRLINGEGDDLPGLVVDRYGDTLVVSISIQGMEKIRPLLFEILQELVQPKFLYEKSDGKSRKREGLENRCVWLQGSGSDDCLMMENGLTFKIDPVSGQKTGFFLDQRDNRALLQTVSQNFKVLNCFSYSAGFSLYAIRGGAASVTSVDISEAANALAATNFQLNQMDDKAHPLVTADVFQFLRQTQESYDLIVLDPPAFAKTQHEIPAACRGYKDINLNALKKLKTDGLLMTFSCSNHLDEPLFQKVVLGAVNDAGRSAQVLKVLGPGADHPYNLAHSEGRYLKGLLLRIN